MSYTSESTLKRSAKLVQVEELISLLGYRKVDDGLKIPSRVTSYFWTDNKDYRSYVGVELGLYRSKVGQIKITTRSRAGRSYWDLVHQNKTLKTLRDLFGGHFVTDAGRNRYWRPEEPPPSPIASGCFTARWRFHNALGQARIYLMSRKFEGNIAREKPSGLSFIDERNPRLLSNNFLLPYIIAVWEDYFRSTFIAALSYSSKREAAFKKVRLDHKAFEALASGSQSIEQAVGDSFSFQRPAAVAENFKLLDTKLDLGAALRRPYRRRKVSLFDSIDKLVENRNELVHTGRVDISFFDREMNAALSNVEAGVNRCYEHLAKHYGFVASHDY